MDHFEKKSQLNWLRHDLGVGRITRREFTRRMAALGVTSTLASTLGANLAMAAAPKKGGRLRLAMGHGSTTDTTDPAGIENGYQSVLTYAIGNTLTELHTDGTLIPCLATSWEASADAATWTFELRKGVEFSDGRTMTAKDVLASINYHWHEDSKSPAKPLIAGVTSMQADGDHTVVFSLSSGNADFPWLFDTENFLIYPATANGGLDWESRAGTGAFVLKDYEPGVRAYLERNPYYWKEDRGHADEVELLTIIDQTARTNALVTGQVDVIDSVDVKTASLLDKKPGIFVEETAGPLHYTFPMRTDTPPFDDNNVRLALKYAVDREALLKTVLGGHGVLGNDHPIGSSYPFHAADLEQRVYDPDKAKYHLKQAGLTKLTVDLSAADAAFPGAVDAAVLYREHAAESGIDINVVREPNDGYWSNVWLQKAWSACYWAGYPMPDSMLTVAYAAGGSWNDSYWSHERFNKILVEARAELNETRRQELYTEMQSIIRDEGGVVVPMFANNILARNDKVAHGELSAARGFDGRRIIERWWVA